MNMLEMYDNSIKNGKDKVLAIYQRLNGDREKYTYNDIATQADQLSIKLKDIGLKKGDRIGIISSLRPMWFALHYVCLKDGYIMVCIDPGIPALQMQNMLLETEVRAVFTSIKTVFLPKELEEHIPVFSIDVDFPLISKCNKIDNILIGDCKKMPEETFYVLFSSGTTNEKRKAVLLPNSSITKAIEYCKNIQIGIDYANCQRDLLMFPPYHIAGLFCINYDVCYNTTIIILERLIPNGLMSALQDLKPEIICTVPSMLTSLCKKIESTYSNKPFTKFAVNSALKFNGFLRNKLNLNIGLSLFKQINKKAFGGELKCFMTGASPIDEYTNIFFLNMGIDLTMCYGLTELGAPLTTTGKSYYPGTVGLPLKDTDELKFRVVNKDEQGRGEIEVLSPFRMLTYMNEKDNEFCFTHDGYFRTGDLGYIDQNGCIVICGRIKESIVLKNGEKLLPEEIEKKYQNLDCISDLIVFKVPDDGGCDAFSIAIIKDKDKGIPDEPTKTRVYDRANNLPPMYRPKDVYIVKEFPLSSSHKVQRFRLTQMATEGNDAPITDASMIPVDEDEITSQLRQILIKIGGSQWKTQQLTQGLLLNLDSLATVDLYVAIQDKWQIDLFQTSIQPETFGELLDIVKNYDLLDKRNKIDLNLSEYPKPITKVEKLAYNRLEKIVKQIYRVKANGVYNLPKDTSYIICPNHRTFLDPAYICSVLPKKIVNKTCIVGKAEIVESKIEGRIARLHNFIPVDRTGNSIQTLDRCRELLKEGYNILIFPEGTNVENNTTLYPLKDGAAKLSIDTNKPLIPVHITGVGHISREISKTEIPPLSSKIRIKFGEPIYPNGLSVAELNAILSQKIQELD